MRIRWSQLLPSMPWLYRFCRAGNAQRVAEIVAAQSSLMNSVKADYDEILTETGGEFLRKSRGLILLYDSEKDFKGVPGNLPRESAWKSPGPALNLMNSLQWNAVRSQARVSELRSPIVIT